VSSLSTPSDTINDERLRYPPPGAFDYEFGALDDLDNPLTKSYMDLVYSMFGEMSREQVLFMNLLWHLPGWFIRYTFEKGSDPALEKARENRNHVHRVASELIEQKRQEMLVGQSEKDVLSLLGASHQVSPPPLRRSTSLCSQSKRRPGRTFEITRRGDHRSGSDVYARRTRHGRKNCEQTRYPIRWGDVR